MMIKLITNRQCLLVLKIKTTENLNNHFLSPNWWALNYAFSKASSPKK